MQQVVAPRCTPNFPTRTRVHPCTQTSLACAICCALLATRVRRTLFVQLTQSTESPPPSPLPTSEQHSVQFHCTLHTPDPQILPSCAAPLHISHHLCCTARVRPTAACPAHIRRFDRHSVPSECRSKRRMGTTIANVQRVMAAPTP
jgi:hypothetical protein